MNNKMNKFKFRVEYTRDIETIAIATARDIIIVDIEKSLDIPEFDPEVTVITKLNLWNVIKLLRKIPDMHLAIQTITEPELYTGIRDYNLN